MTAQGYARPDLLVDTEWLESTVARANELVQGLSGDLAGRLEDPAGRHGLGPLV